MQYILCNKGSGTVSYAHIAPSGALTKVKDRSMATVFASQHEVDQIKHKYRKKLKSFQREAIPEKKIAEEPKMINAQEEQKAEKECQRKSVSKTLRMQVYNQAEGRCAICGDFVPYDNFTIDHIFPVAKGGNNEISNLQCTCHQCNQMKQTMSEKEFECKIGKIFFRQIIKRIKNRKKEK